MAWYIFVIFGITVHSLTEILRKIVLSGKYKVNYYTTAFLLSVVTSIVLGLYVMVVGFQMPPIASFAWIFVLNMTLGIVGLLTSQRGLSHLSVGDFTVLMTSQQVITWFASVLLLGVGLTLQQGIGSTLIITAILIIFLGKDTFHHASKAGLFFTALTALNYGFAMLTDQVVYRYSDPASFLFVGFTLTAVILLLIRPRVAKSMRLLKPTRQGLQLFSLGFGNGLGLALLFTGLKRIDNAPLYSGLSQMGIILSVVLGMVLLGERNHVVRKLIGSVLAAVGAFLLVL